MMNLFEAVKLRRILFCFAIAVDFFETLFCKLVLEKKKKVAIRLPLIEKCLYLQPKYVTKISKLQT